MHQMDRIQIVMRAVMRYPPHPIRPRIYPRLAIAHQRIVGPAPLPQSVDHFKEFLGRGVALIVVRQAALPRTLGSAVQDPGDDVPGHPAFGQVIQRGETTGEQVGPLVGQRGGDTETKIFGHGSHQRNDRERVERGRLRRGANGGIGAASVNVVDPDHIRQKHRVQQSAFRRLRQLGPVFRRVMPNGDIVRMRPEPRPGVARCVHVERVQADFLRHVIRLPRHDGR
jgi:hypothetical protein